MLQFILFLVYLLANNLDTIQEFSQVIQDLSNLYSLRIIESEDAIKNNADLVKDSIEDTKIYLYVPDELRKAFKSDSGKLDEKKGKLLKELEKLNKMMSGHSYKENASAQEQDIHSKKVSNMCIT